VTFVPGEAATLVVGAEVCATINVTAAANGGGVGDTVTTNGDCFGVAEAGDADNSRAVESTGTDGVGEVVDRINSPWEGVAKPHTTLA
jgi:hypothetical protein